MEREMFSPRMKSKIVDSLYKEARSADTFLKEILMDGFDGVNNMQDRELFRFAMMHGLLDEDAGSER